MSTLTYTHTHVSHQLVCYLPFSKFMVKNESFFIIFCLGISGLEYLANINPAFTSFKSILFSESSSMFERSLQAADINKKLDLQINKYLTQLSPYMLLNAAHRTIEWLIYK